MRPTVFLAKMATWAAWPATRQDRRPGRLVPPVLCYHRVLPRGARARRQPKYSVTPEQFDEQMSLLVEEGFVSLTLEEYREAALGLRETPERSVLVTFDDGFADNYSVAWPIARRHGVRLNLFVCTGLISGEAPAAFRRETPEERASREQFPELWRPLSWAEVRELDGGGHCVGFHSHGHENWGRLSAAQTAADLSKGAAAFEAHLGHPPRFFAFPFGHFGSYTSEALEALAGRGIEMSFSTELGRTPLGETGRLFSRVVIHSEDDLGSFRRKLFGGYDWVGRVRRFVYQARSALGARAVRAARV